MDIQPHQKYGVNDDDETGDAGVGTAITSGLGGLATSVQDCLELFRIHRFL